MTFAERLRKARERAGLTSDEAARRIGVSMPNYSAWENDRRTPNTERQAFALATLRVVPAPPELSEVLARYQGEAAELLARFGADLLRTADDERFRLIADALTRTGGSAVDRAETARAAAEMPPLTAAERAAIETLAATATAPPAGQQGPGAPIPARRRKG